MTTIDIAEGRLTLLRDGVDQLPRALFTAPADDGGEPMVEIPINAFLYQTNDRCILIDTGGAGLAPGLGGVSERLASLGVTPEQVDTVFCTHLHLDHIGGLISDGSPVFSNARLLIHADEQAFWKDAEMRSGASEPFLSMINGAGAVLDAYAGRIRSYTGGTEIAPQVAAIHLPGHTPGHSGLQFGAPDTGILMFADVVHSAALQLADPAVGIVFDANGVQAADTRQRILAQLANSSLTVAGCHLDGFGQIQRAGQGYAFQPTR